MVKIITPSKLEALRIEAKASGNRPHLVAKYSEAKRELETLVSALFDEDHPYTYSASDSYLERLKVAAELPEATEVDIARYEIIRDRKENGAGASAKDIRVTSQELMQALRSGEEITEAHIMAAKRLAVQISSTENRVLVSAVKRQMAEQQAGKPIIVAEEARKITQEDLDAAREKAAKSSRIEDRVAFATLKADIAGQNEADDSQ